MSFKNAFADRFIATNIQMKGLAVVGISKSLILVD